MKPFDFPEGFGDGVHDTVKMHMPLPRFFRSAVLRYMMITQHHYDKAIALAAQLAHEEFAKTKGE